MIVIFAGSTDLLSSQRTSRIIGPLLRWFKPNVSDRTVQQVQFVARKIGHLLEYAILALLLWRAMAPAAPDANLFPWRLASWVVIISAIYAVTDEWHQAYQPTRYASVFDILIDTLGAAMGLTFRLAGRRPSPGV